MSITVSVLYGVSLLHTTVPLRADRAPPIRTDGIVSRGISRMRKSLSFQVKPISDTSIRTTPREKMICRTPNHGMRTKTVKNVPNMLPPVEME